MAVSVSSALLAWYDRCARTLPWRGIHDPYRTWVSEAMLQQTRVDTVLSYYDRFLKRFPTLEALAGAEEADVLKYWEGLGYYSRARNLHRGAQQIMKDWGGIIPSSPDHLRKISGIGPYMAGAIASIAFSVQTPAVDGNVIRVISRLFGIREDVSRPAVRKEIERIAADLVPPDRPGDHNQAMMDLGATVCIPGTPDCACCPLSAFCNACHAGDAADLPRIPKARPPKVIPWTVLIIRTESEVLLRRREEKLLQGLWCFPMMAGHPDAEDIPASVQKEFALSSRELRDEGASRHVFTHQIWEMRLFSMSVTHQAAPAGFEWVPMDRLSSLAFPSAMNAALKVCGFDKK